MLIFSPEYFELLLMCASAKLEDDIVEEADVGIMWLGWFTGCEACACGEETGDGDDERDKLLDKDIADPCKEWAAIWPLDEVPVADEEVNEEPECMWLAADPPTPAPWAVSNWLEYNWSTAECIGNTASIIVHLFMSTTHICNEKL